MALLGQGALAMWWDIAPEHRAEFEDWYTHEHLPERMGIAGFRRGSRWAAADGGEGFFVLYELAAHAPLASPDYLTWPNAPTPWTSTLMPHHRHLVRCQCRVLESSGGALSRHALTVRLSPHRDTEERLRIYLRELARALSSRPGTTAGHLLRHEAPAIEATTEQKIRGGADATADWIFIACGDERATLEGLARIELSEVTLTAAGARAQPVQGLYTLSHTNSADDIG